MEITRMPTLEDCRDDHAAFADALASWERVAKYLIDAASRVSEPSTTHTGETTMRAIVVPSKTLVHIDGIPVLLAVDTIVEASEDAAPMLSGYAYAHLPAQPTDPPPSDGEKGTPR